MSKKKYTVSLYGTVVGTRKSDRIYTHAVVRVVDLVAQRAWIARPAADYDEPLSKSNFNYLVRLGGKGAGDYSAYLELLRTRAMATFDKQHGLAVEEAYVVGYCGRHDLAVKLLASEAGARFDKELKIVPVEVQE